MSRSNLSAHADTQYASACSSSDQLSPLLRDGRYEEAVLACGELIASRPEDSAPYICLAQLAHMAGDLQQAANFLGEAIVREPSNGSAFAHLSDVLWELDRKEFSIRTLDTAIALGQNDTDRFRTLADRLYQNGSTEQARLVYERVLEIEPGCLRSRSMLTLLASTGDKPTLNQSEAASPSSHIEVLQRKPEWKRVHLSLIAPPGYPHVKAFADLLKSIESTFRRMGSSTTFAINETRHEAVNIVFGGHLIGPDVDRSCFPRTTVFFNLEQAGGFGLDRFPVYKDLMLRFPVWDYSDRNAALLRSLGAAASVLRLGYEPTLETIAMGDHYDCDVLFYGSLNARREAILSDLRAAGLTVRHLFNVYDEERNRAIAAAKVVVNVHYYEDAIHEIVRTSHLLANRKAVVSECSAITEIDDDVRHALIAVPYEDIVHACVRLVRDDAAREALEQRGYEIFKRRDQLASLISAIEATQFA